MHATLLILFCSGFLAPDGAQNPRPAQRVDTSTGIVIGTAVGSDGDFSVVAYSQGDPYSTRILASCSDGRGLTWSAPVPVDGGFFNAHSLLAIDSVSVAGDRAYVYWRDQRHGPNADEIYFNFSPDRGASWVGERRLDKGRAIGSGYVQFSAMAVSPEAGGADHVYVLMSVVPAPGAKRELVLAASHDGGVSFQPSTRVGALGAGTADVNGIGLAAQGQRVHVVWADDRVGTERGVYYQVSNDGGLSWLPADLRLDTTQASTVGNADQSVVIAARGSRLLVVWNDRDAGATSHDLRFNHSSDGGLSWDGDQQFGDAIPGVDDTRFPQLFLNDDAMVVAWEDDREGVDNVFVAVSTDLGVSWKSTQLSQGSGIFPRLASDPSSDTIALSWSGFYAPSPAFASLGLASGRSWTPAFELSDNLADVDTSSLAMNPRYGNFIASWMAQEPCDNHTYTGGFRAATLRLSGAPSAGQPLHFEFHYFQPQAASHAMVVASGGLGQARLPGGDGRVLGLRDDPILRASLANPGDLIARIGTDGSGSTADRPWPARLPVGTSVYFVAVGLDPATGAFGDLSDVVHAMVE